MPVLKHMQELFFLNCLPCSCLYNPLCFKSKLPFCLFRKMEMIFPISGAFLLEHRPLMSLKVLLCWVLMHGRQQDQTQVSSSAIKPACEWAVTLVPHIKLDLVNLEEEKL